MNELNDKLKTIRTLEIKDEFSSKVLQAITDVYFKLEIDLGNDVEEVLKEMSMTDLAKTFHKIDSLFKKKSKESLKDIRKQMYDLMLIVEKQKNELKD